MKYPYLNEVPQSREITTYFSGYNHNISCQEGEFYDTKNISTKDYPIFSTRDLRGVDKTFTDLQGIINKDSLVWVDNKKLYINNVEKDLGSIELTAGEKTIAKMGGYIAIFPDKVWYNTKDNTKGSMDETYSLSMSSSNKLYFQIVDADGNDINLWNGTDTLTDGAYKINTTTDGKRTLQVYSKTTGMWMNVASTFYKIYFNKPSTTPKFKEGDGVKITLSLTSSDYTSNKDKLNFIYTYPNKEGKRKRSNNFVIEECGVDENDSTKYYIIVPGILGSANFNLSSSSIKIERKAPDIAYVCECQNRLWGCSSDGHEIYACKQGDLTNWNCFAGVATDSWTATVGSDGLFTGAFSYMGYPLFFKENSLLKVTVSGYGAHSYRETLCRGVQAGSSKSLVLLNELLYYKSATNVCYYDGNFPQEIGEKLGEVRYKNAVAGSVNNRYYINMQDSNNDSHMFVFDSNKNTWVREDDVKVDFFSRNGDELYFVSDNKLYSVGGQTLYTSGKESNIEWYATSGNIGYYSPDKKYVSRIDIKMQLELGSEAKFWINYDSSSTWIPLWSMNGRGDKSFAIPIRPNRCDHFRYKITGTGPVKIFSITKTVEEGSDL